MKNALILHGTDGSPTENWFEWLRQELQKLEIETVVPQLPRADRPNIHRYNQFLLNEIDFDFNKESILIGHSSGAVAILGLLQALPAAVKVDTCYLIGAFRNDLGWEALSELFITPLNFDKIKTKARRFIFIHSDNDPYCPLRHAEELNKKLDGQLIIKSGQKHFSIGTFGESYRTFPFLLELILEKKHA